MVGGKRKLTSPVSDKEPANKLRKTKTGQGSRLGSKEQELVMFKRSQPIIPLDQIPLEALERLLNFLDVVSLTQLASTNQFFQQLVAGRYLVNIHFPFDQVNWTKILLCPKNYSVFQAFLDDLSAASVIEKKPLLRMTCSKVRFKFSKFQNFLCLKLRQKVIPIFSKRKAFQHVVPNGLQPLINCQLSMLDLSRCSLLVLQFTCSCEFPFFCSCPG